MIEHVISRNCRVVYRGRDYAQAANAWGLEKRGALDGDRLAWDHESTDRDDFAPDPHCGLVTIPAVEGHPQKYVLTVARYERGKGGRVRGMGSPKVGAR